MCGHAFILRKYVDFSFGGGLRGVCVTEYHRPGTMNLNVLHFCLPYVHVSLHFKWSGCILLHLVCSLGVSFVDDSLIYSILFWNISVFIAKVIMGGVCLSHWFGDIWHLKYGLYAEGDFQLTENVLVCCIHLRDNSLVQWGLEVKPRFCDLWQFRLSGPDILMTWVARNDPRFMHYFRFGRAMTCGELWAMLQKAVNQRVIFGMAIKALCMQHTTLEFNNCLCSSFR